MQKKITICLVLLVGGILAFSTQTQAANCGLRVNISTTSNCQLDIYLNCTGTCTQTRTYWCDGDCPGDQCCQTTGTTTGITSVTYSCTGPGGIGSSCDCTTSGTVNHGPIPTCGCV